MLAMVHNDSLENRKVRWYIQIYTSWSEHYKKTNAPFEHQFTVLVYLRLLIQSLLSFLASFISLPS